MQDIKYFDNYLPNDVYDKLRQDVTSIYNCACKSVKNKSRIYMTYDTTSRIKTHFNSYPGLNEYMKAVINKRYNYIIHGILFLEENQHGIRRHINSTMKDIVQETPYRQIGFKYKHPDYQTVTYANLPTDLQQGILTIHDPKTQDKTSIPPVNNRLIQFPGCCPHEVSEIKTADLRITLFTEQYNLSTEDLLTLRGKFFESGTLVDVGVHTESSDDIQSGEFQMPYDG